MPKKSKAKNPFQGRWRITWMEQWGQESVDEEVEGYFEFEPKGMGSFQFGYVRGQVDYRPSTRDGKPCIEFTWDGTRGKKLVILVGTKKALAMTVNREDTSQRYTALKRRLQES